jgi:hypothetical protein
VVRLAILRHSSACSRYSEIFCMLFPDVLMSLNLISGSWFPFHRRALVMTKSEMMLWRLFGNNIKCF